MSQSNLAITDRDAFTPHTLKTPTELAHAVQSVHDTGLGQTNRSFEEENSNIAAPVFDQASLLAGAVSVASVARDLPRHCKKVYDNNLCLPVRRSLETGAVQSLPLLWPTGPTTCLKITN